MAAPALFIAFLGLVALVLWLSYQRKRRRREALAALGRASGLRFSVDDPFDLVDQEDFHLFRMGEGRGCENVLWGDWKGIPVKEADYWYYTQSTDAQGHTTRDYRYLSIVEAALPCTIPKISIQRETIFSRLGERLGFDDIEFESEDFNHTFQVKAVDVKFAFRLVDARMMQWLLESTDGFGFELGGSNLLVHCNRQRSEAVEAVLDTALAFRDRIPRLIWNEYGTTPSNGSESSERSAS
jgi:hypothetical protein